MNEYIPRINIEENRDSYMYCTSCGCSEQIRPIYNISFDNMVVRVCGNCMDHMYKALTAMRKSL